MQALILAGGKGTRLNEITKDEIPKPMAKLNNKPILEHVIERLKENGIKDIFMSVGYLHEKIEDYFKNGAEFGVNITYLVEETPLGSGGALYFLKDKIKNDFLVCSCDALFDIDIDKMYQFHKKNNALITLFSHPNLHPYDSDLLIVNNKNVVTRIDFKNAERTGYYKNCVNAGLFIIDPKTLEYFTTLRKINMEHDFVNYYLSTNRVYSYKSPEYIKDVGTPERFLQAQDDINAGVVSLKNLQHKQKAIFIDRDGTINKYKGFIKNANDIELIDGVIEAIKKINRSEYLAIIVSNQPVIARGEASFEEVEKMFDKIETILGNNHAYVDGIYYCPHHPHIGFEGEIKELKIKCDCRKPNIGMIKQAQENFNLDLSKCYLIGDTNTDVQTAKNAGMKSIKVKSCIIEDTLLEPTFYAHDLLEAVSKILD